MECFVGGRAACVLKMLVLDLCIPCTILVEADPEPNAQLIIALLLPFKLMTKSLPHLAKVRSDLRWAAGHSGTRSFPHCPEPLQISQ